MTSRQHMRTLPDDGIIDPIAVELAASGIRPVVLTWAERQLAAARILARGGTPYLISKRLHVSGATALKLAARCQHKDPAVECGFPVAVAAMDGAL